MATTVTRIPHTDDDDSIGDTLDIVIRDSDTDRIGRHGLLHNESIDEAFKPKHSKLARFAVCFVITLIVVMATILLVAFFSPPHHRKGKKEEVYGLVTNSSVIDYTNETEAFSKEEITFVRFRTGFTRSTPVPLSTDFKNASTPSH